MKKITLALAIFPFFSFAQHVDVLVENTTIEFSGGTYDLNASSNSAEVTLHLFNTSDSIRSWNIERVSPLTNHWHEWFFVLGSSHNASQGMGYQSFSTPTWTTNHPITVIGDTFATVLMHWNFISQGCDLFSYYVIEDGARVDSFNINICKTASLDESSPENVSIYPNPSNSVLNVDFKANSPEQVLVFDILGNEIANLEAFSSMEIVTTEFSDGIYILSWKIEGVYFRRKFQVQH